MYWLSYFSFSTFNKTKRGFQILGILNCRLKWNILVVFFRLWSQTSRWRWWSLWRPFSQTSGGCRLLNSTNSRRRTSCPCWINSFCRSQSVPFLQSVTYVIWYIWFNDIPLIYHTVLDDVYWDLKICDSVWVLVGQFQNVSSWKWARRGTRYEPEYSLQSRYSIFIKLFKKTHQNRY